MPTIISLGKSDVKLVSELKRWLESANIEILQPNADFTVQEANGISMGNGNIFEVGIEDLAKFCVALKGFLKNLRRPPTKFKVTKFGKSLCFETGQLIDVDSTIEKIFEFLETANSKDG